MKVVWYLLILAALALAIFNFIQIDFENPFGNDSTIAIGGSQWLLCPKGLLRTPDPRALLLSCLFAVPLLVIIKGANLFGLESVWLRLFVSGVLFIVLYALPVWRFDPRLRDALRQWRLARAS